MKFTKKQTALLTAALLVVAAVFAGIYLLSRPAADTGVKVISIETINGAVSNSHTVETRQQYLGQALREGGFVQGEEGGMGLFILTVDGYTADSAKQEWWCITKSGEAVNTGADSTPIADGEQYEITLTTGF